MKASIVFAVALAAGSASANAAPYSVFPTLSGEAPKVIAHRGASGYLPEHTLGGYELAIQMGADIIEPDLQWTSDGVLVAIHDGTLTRTTNVEDLFAERNGGYAVSDFTLAEIKTLTVEPSGSTASDSYEDFTPVSPDPYTVPTFGEVMALVNAHNTATGDNLGIYPEAKTPNSTAMNQQIIDEMAAAGFKDRDQLAILQTFDHMGARELSQMQDLADLDNAIAALGSAVLVDDVLGVFGLSDSVNGTVSLFSDLATFADGMGVSVGSIDRLGTPELALAFIQSAHDHGLEVHGWTFRPTTIEEAREDFNPWIEAGMDAFFTDYPDLGVAVVAESMALVPLPAGLPLLLAGLGGFAVLRQRRA